MENEENKAVETNEEATVTAPTQAAFDALLAERDALKHKTGQLLSETKKAKAQRTQAQEDADRVKREEATKAGDFEQLFKSSEDRLANTQKELAGLHTTISNEKRANSAMKIATELADGPNAEILAEFIGRRIKYTDEGVKVVNDAGELTVSTVNELKEEFRNSSRYASLLKGNQSSGSSASGNSNTSGSAANAVTRAEFEQMDPVKKMAFIKKGGSVGA